MDEGLPPSESDWWDDGVRKKAAGCFDDGAQVPGCPGQGAGKGNERGAFVSCGLSNWQRARQIWRTPTTIVSSEDGGDEMADSGVERDGAVRAPPLPRQRLAPPPVKYEEVIKGLMQVSRAYELPGRMTLPDLVEVYVDIWDCERDN